MVGPTGPSPFMQRGIRGGGLVVDGFAFNERKYPLDPYQNIFSKKDLKDIFKLVRFQKKKKIRIVVGLELMKTCVN